jgi:DeoR/GlpR family transcriptional regulator of sugar metabolism
MVPSERRRRILQAVAERRSVTVGELSGLFDVSPITLRRDLDRLAEENLVERVHGGAMSREAIAVAPRASDQPPRLSEAQRAIGLEAAQRVRDGDYLVLESGSTCLAVVPHLGARRRLRVVTSSPRLLTALSAAAKSTASDMEIISCGGTLAVDKDFLLGPHARMFFESCRVDLALCSVTAIDPAAGITADSLAEAEITRIILETCAKKRIGLIVSGKLERTSFARVAAAEILDEIITDSGASPAVIQRYRDKGIRVTVV